MHEYLSVLFSAWPTLAVIAVVAVSLAVLSKGADLLVDNAVLISARSGIPKSIIGATIVSLGTTLPESAVSITAAVRGNPGLALGNAVGSIICNAALIIGLAALIRPLAVKRAVTDSQGWFQLGTVGLLIGVGIVYRSAEALVGSVPQWVGFAFLAVLAGYVVLSVRWARSGANIADVPAERSSGSRGTPAALFVLGVGVALVVLGSRTLIPAVEILALRARIPESVIAATLVAVGTSLPELVTAVTSARRGHGELAIGNVIGANVLNVLLVVGASAAVTPGGLSIPPIFYAVFFPSMAITALIFRATTLSRAAVVGRLSGGVLLSAYAVYLVVGYLA